MAGFEGGIDIRRDDRTLDCSLNWIARNGEVHFTIEVYSQYGLAKTIVDLTSAESHEIGGTFREAARQAGPAEGVVPMSVAREPQRNLAGPGWTPQDVGHVLGERD